jgi:hypothetical protein
MTTIKNLAVSKEDAEAVFEAIKTKYSAYIEEGYGPELRHNWTWGWTAEHTYEWAIVWEEGSPYDWALSALDESFDEALYFEAKEFGEDFARRIATTPAIEAPNGVWADAITGWAAWIRPAW